MKPFANESVCLIVDGLTIKNSLDRVSVYGSVDFTRDQKGLKAARYLKATLDDIIDVLEAVTDLPEAIVVESQVRADKPAQ